MAESSGNPNAVNGDCIGLCQISPIVLKEYNIASNKWYKETLQIEPLQRDYTIKDMFSKIANKHVALWYLRRLRDHYLQDMRDKFKTSYYAAEGYTGKETMFGEWRRLPFNNTEDYYIKNGNDLQIALVLAAYNGGITRLRRNGYDINKMPKETQDYVRKIMRAYKKTDK